VNLDLTNEVIMGKITRLIILFLALLVTLGLMAAVVEEEAARRPTGALNSSIVDGTTANPQKGIASRPVSSCSCRK